jgi:hypothetical protein
MNHRNEQRREGILQQMRQIERLRRGTLSEQYYGAGERRQGPYYLLQGYEKGKHWSERVNKEQVEQVRADLAGHSRFEELCQGFVEITEKATLAHEDDVSKKKPRKPRERATERRKPS